MINLKQNIKYLKTLGFTAYKIEKETTIKQTTISNYLNRKGESLNLSNVIKLHAFYKKYFKITLDELIYKNLKRNKFLIDDKFSN